MYGYLHCNNGKTAIDFELSFDSLSWLSNYLIFLCSEITSRKLIWLKCIIHSMMFVYDWLNMRSISILRQKGISLSMIIRWCNRDHRDNSQILNHNTFNWTTESNECFCWNFKSLILESFNSTPVMRMSVCVVYV